MPGNREKIIERVSPKIWNYSFILAFQSSLYYIPNWQANCIPELSASITCITNVQTKKKEAHFKLFFYESFISVFFMNHDCSSYVIICLCIGFDQDFVTGSREQIERGALTHGDKQNQVEHRWGYNFVL